MEVIKINELKQYLSNNFKSRCKIIIDNVSERKWVSDKFFNIDTIILYFEKNLNIIHSVLISKGTLYDKFEEDLLDEKIFNEEINKFLSFFSDYDNETIKIECI